jgi:DNA invertase Pin-like site-specific DNA recombinase
MNEKILPTHISRAAYVYIRQSTLHQVRVSLESQRRQYGLAERARELGFSEVCIIDDDLGRSGAGTQERPGFARLLVAVCESRAGAVFAIEASRLARNNREWHHLVDLCGLTNTLVIDDDGIYDPHVINDRLLLGLKGTMSEFELSLFRQRAHEAIRQMVVRGEVLSRVPVGYTRTPENGCEMIADRQVQDAIRGVFSKFRELGSARQVLLWYCREGLSLPVSHPASVSVIDWKPATYTRIINTRLSNLTRNPES